LNILKSLGLLFNKANIAFSENISFVNKVCLLDVGVRAGIFGPWFTVQNNALNVILGGLDRIKAKVLEDQNKGYVLTYALWNEVLIKHISKMSRGFYLFSNSNKYLYKMFNVLIQSLKSTHHGWANVEQHIGSNKRFNFWA
jgi:hypothetical protein